MGIVVCKLPKAGLGNQLFPLMKAFVFGHLNNLPVIVTGYHQLKIGPYLRKEKTKRKYNNYFIFQRNILGEQIDKWRVLNKKYWQIEKEPLLEYREDAQSPYKLFKFEVISPWQDYFQQLKNYRELVTELLWNQLKENIKKQIEKQPSPYIGIHIRMGDFRKLKEGEDFSKVGLVRTPEKYFVDSIKNIREIHGTSLPVSVFTDGYKHEFEELFLLENVTIMEGNPDIVDMFLLSKSKIIVCSAGSTFSYWAAFLSNAPVIFHESHEYTSFREGDINEQLYSGALLSGNVAKLLMENIKLINFDS
jgi:hypothetical protein